MSNIHTENVQYRSDSTELNGYLAWDEAISGSRPGVLVVHEWWGQNDYVQRRARMLAELGYTAMAIDMYGDGKVADNPQDAEAYMMEVFGDMQSGQERFQAAFDLLAAHEACDSTEISAIGYCFGGAIALHMARIGIDLKAVGSFHPGTLATESPAEAGKFKARVLVCAGADDPMIPAEQRDAFEKEMTNAGVQSEVVIYPGVLHGFSVPEATDRGKALGMPLAYDEHADQDSWNRLKSLLSSVS